MLTSEERFLIGIILGDGNLHRRFKWKNVTSIKLAHAPKEYEWLVYKVNKAAKIIGSNATITKAMNKGDLKAYQWCAGFSKFVHIYNLMYKNGKKVFPVQVLEQLGAEELALFWCDDGCIVKNLRNKVDPRTKKAYPNLLQETVGNLAVYEDLETTSAISNWIEKISGAKASVKLHKKTGLYYLLFNKKALVNLCSTLFEYIPKCMYHKIDLTAIPISERARIHNERAIRRQERVAT